MGATTGAVAFVWPMAALTLAFAFKHFVADFVFQNSWIACGKDGREGWLTPLVTHALVHGGLTLLIALAVAPRLWWLGVLDAAIHFAIDRGKTLVGRWGRWSAQQSPYWWLLGFDQFLHQATNIGLAAFLLSR